jgi:hypothetical protein
LGKPPSSWASLPGFFVSVSIPANTRMRREETAPGGNLRANTYRKFVRLDETKFSRLLSAEAPRCSGARRQYMSEQIQKNRELG